MKRRRFMETPAQKGLPLFVVSVGAAIGGMGRGDGGGGGRKAGPSTVGLSVGLKISHEPGDGGGGGR